MRHLSVFHARPPFPPSIFPRRRSTSIKCTVQEGSEDEQGRGPECASGVVREFGQMPCQIKRFAMRLGIGRTEQRCRGYSPTGPTRKSIMTAAVTREVDRRVAQENRAVARPAEAASEGRPVGAEPYWVINRSFRAFAMPAEEGNMLRCMYEMAVFQSFLSMSGMTKSGGQTRCVPLLGYQIQALADGAGSQCSSMQMPFMPKRIKGRCSIEPIVLFRGGRRYAGSLKDVK